MAEWTLDRRRDPHPFHLRPTLTALLAPGPAPPAPEAAAPPATSAGRRRTDDGGAAIPTRREVAVGGRVERGLLRARQTLPTDEGFRYPGPAEGPRRGTGEASLFVRDRIGPLALVADGTVDDRTGVDVAHVGARLGPVVVSAGRQGLWPGHACRSGIVLSGRGRADGAGIDTRWLDVPLLGPVSLSGFFGTLEEASTDNRRPLFLVQRAVWAPGDDVLLGITRAAVFGGRGTSVPVTLRTVGLMLLGVTDIEGKDSDFENQVASVDLSWRIPGEGSATRLHLEYGADDSGLSFLRVPAVSVGADRVTTTDGHLRVLEAELAWIAPSNRGHPPWYRHGALAWGWTDRGVPLGHDLGGEGWGLRLGGLQAAGEEEYHVEVLATRRGGENLLAPTGQGWGIEALGEGRTLLMSWAGGELLAGWRLRAGRLGGHGVVEAGLSAIYRF